MTAKSVFADLVSKVFHVWKKYEMYIWLVKLSKGRTPLGKIHSLFCCSST